ncbi:hypothetical protein ACN42_g10368 [Penicillium freii]|uniref:Uncharacterized protein n=1 Tax=Penicillium freii TaxID=48697 RepID=A0A101MAB0_PENFR|nr:hypothetical protein ACN42_g10368 [Penicillium freii]
MGLYCWNFTFPTEAGKNSIDQKKKNKTKRHDKSGIRTHASCETRKLLLVVESRYTLTWRLRPTRPSYQ